MCFVKAGAQVTVDAKLDSADIFIGQRIGMTLEVSADAKSNVELPECGTHRFHHLKEVRSTSYGIDHININNPDVNYKGNENLKIFFNGSAQE